MKGLSKAGNNTFLRTFSMLPMKMSKFANNPYDIKVVDSLISDNFIVYENRSCFQLNDADFSISEFSCTVCALAITFLDL